MYSVLFSCSPHSIPRCASLLCSHSSPPFRYFNNLVWIPDSSRLSGKLHLSLQHSPSESLLPHAICLSMKLNCTTSWTDVLGFSSLEPSYQRCHCEITDLYESQLMRVPSPIISSFRTIFSFSGRFVMGYSAGSGFVCAPAVLRLAVPESMRPTNFLFLAAAFSMGTFLANSMFLTSFLVSPTVLSAGLTAMAGRFLFFLSPYFSNFQAACTWSFVQMNIQLKSAQRLFP